MKYRPFKSGFVGGELSPFMLGRYELDQYRLGASRLRDVTILPQGGVMRRTGFALVEVATAAAIRQIPFSRGAALRYMLHLTEAGMVVYRDGQRVHLIPADQFPYTAAQVPQVDYAQFADTIVLAHGEHPLRRIMWNGGDTMWQVEEVTITTPPQRNFDDDLSPQGEDEIQRIGLTEFQDEQGSPPPTREIYLELEGFETDPITFTRNTDTMARRIQEALTALTITPPTGIEVEPTSGQPLGTFTVTFGGEAQDDWSQIRGRDGADNPEDRLTVTVTTIQDGVSREEDAWSQVRGYPSVVTFFENRLFVAGTNFLPQTFWASRTGRYFDFNEGDGSDNDAFNDTLSTATNVTILGLNSGRELQIFTESTEHYCPVAPITPGNHPFPAQTSNGIRPNTKPTDVDGAVYFARRDGSGIRQFLFSREEQSYTSDNPGIMSEHLLNNVGDLTSRQGVEGVDGNYLYAINNDGLMAVYNLLRAQNVGAWSAWEAAHGQFSQARAVDEELYAVVTVGTTKVVCRADNTRAFDLSQSFSNASQVTLSNSDIYPDTVQVRADGFWLGDFAKGDGTITLPRQYASIEVGANFIPEVSPCDIADVIGPGVNRSKKKRIHRLYVDLVNSLGWTVDYAGKQYQAGNARVLPIMLDQAQQKPITGTVEKRLMGYITEGNVTLRQTIPHPGAAIISITTEIKTQ